MGLVLKTFATWITEVFVSKSSTWQLLVCAVSCWCELQSLGLFEYKKRFGKNSIQQNPISMYTVIRSVKVRVCEGVMIILLRKERDSRISKPKKTKLKTDGYRTQWGLACRIFLLAESLAYIGICVKFIGLFVDLGKWSQKTNAPFLYNFLFKTDFYHSKICPHPQTSTLDYLMHSYSHSFPFKTDFAGCVLI